MTRAERTGGRLAFALSLPLFVLLCTLNSAGYRFGASDQAFYVPAVLNEIEPALFPRDDEIIESQARLTPIDETLAAIVHVTGADVPELYAALYVASLGLLAWAAWQFGHRLYRSEWTVVALLAALTLRHAIAHSGTNTLEPYFHPRQLVFGMGALAIVAFLRGSLAWPAVLVGLGALLHPTTALWFAVWLGVAAFVAVPKARLPLTALGAAGAILSIWMLTFGPLAGRLSVMDPAWIATLETKGYLFPTEWRLDVWLLNLVYAPVILLVYRQRSIAGLVDARERAMVAGCLALLVPFVAALPLIASHVAIAVQMQPARIFWMLDFVAVVYAVWWLAEAGTLELRRTQAVAAAVLLLSFVRGTYVMAIVYPERPLAQVNLADDDWGRVMAWMRTTPPWTGCLADPMHAVKYGTSVRVAGERDVLVEAVKDTAIGMYSREVAMRTRERIEAVADFAALTPARARALGQRYGLDYLVTEQRLALPAEFESGALRVYRLRDPDGPPATGPSGPR